MEHNKTYFDKHEKEKFWHWFMEDQEDVLELDKFIDSFKAGRDLFYEQYYIKWVTSNAKQYRKEWIEKHGALLYPYI